MAINLTKLGTDLDYIINDLPTTVTISSVDYTCTRATLTREQIYTDYGLGDEYSFSIYLNLDSAPDPDIHTLVTISAVEYRILEKEIDAVNKLIRLHLGAKYGKN